jgi:hypothetical protein
VARQEKFIGAPLEAKVRLQAGRELYPLLEEYFSELTALFITSQVLLENHSNADLSGRVGAHLGVEVRTVLEMAIGFDAAYPTVCDSQ